jgi:drug/metabolite transporter (DMT)-like permease
MVFLALLASFFKSIANIAEKQVLTEEGVEIYSSQLSFVLAFISLPLLFFVKSFDISNSALLVTYGASFCAIVSALTSVWIIKKMDLSESAVLFAASPIIIAIAAGVLLHEKLTPMIITGILVSCLGIFILEYHNPKSEKHNLAFPAPHGIPGPDKKMILYFILFISLICFSLGAIADRFVIYNMGIDPVLYLIVVQFFILFNFALIDLFVSKRLKRKVINPRLFLRKSFWTNVIFILAHRVSHMFAVQMMQISILNAIKQSAAVFTTILGGRIFREKHMLKRSIACLAVVCGVVLVIVG